MPRNVAGAVAVEVAGERRRPARRMRADVDAAGPQPVCDLPDIDMARGRIEPENIVGAVGVEIAEAGRLIARRMRAGIGAPGPLAVRELPDIDAVGARIVPGKIAAAVIIEVGDARGRPARPDAVRHRRSASSAPSCCPTRMKSSAARLLRATLRSVSVSPPPKLITVSLPTCVARARTSANVLTFENAARLTLSSLPAPAAKPKIVSAP